MTIVNGYCTLAELKDRLLQARTYTATTISFDTTADTVSDTAYGLKRYQTGDVVKISGSTSNDGYYTISSGNSASSFTVSTNLTTEVAGDTVTITTWSDLEDDATLEAVIESVSRRIDQECDRRFWTTSSDESRYFTPEAPSYCPTGDLISVTALYTDDQADRTYSTTWTTSDYELGPLNAALDSWPYDGIWTKPSGSESFDAGGRWSVKVTGKFGFCTLANRPKPVHDACLLWAVRLFKRPDAPFGVTGVTPLGQAVRIQPVDPDVQQLLAPYVRRGFGGGYGG